MKELLKNIALAFVYMTVGLLLVALGIYLALFIKNL